MPTTHDTDVREAWTVRLVWHDKTTGEWLPVFRFNLFETVVESVIVGQFYRYSGWGRHEFYAGIVLQVEIRTDYTLSGPTF